MSNHLVEQVAKALRGEYWKGPKSDSSYCLSYTNNNSVGNRYINWHGLWAESELNTKKGVKIDHEEAHDHITQFDQRQVFHLIANGIYVGPATKEAIKDCAQMVENDNPPPAGGPKHNRHVNHLGGVNHIDDLTLHEWNFKDKLWERVSNGLREDHKNKELLSPDWHYYKYSHSGWSRST